MGKQDVRVDTYIEKSADYAKPILIHLRQSVHASCPGAEETIKWGVPHFEYRGIMCSMAAFKNHCIFGFWNESIMKDPQGLFPPAANKAMGSLGQIRSLSDLPPDDVLQAYIAEAAALNEAGVKSPRSTPSESKEVHVPDDLATALQANEETKRTFEAFSFSNKRDYVEWLTEAKSEATRNKRLATALEWLAEGKTRNWKYEKKTR